LLIALSLLGSFCAVLGAEYFPATYQWDFHNNCFLGFNQSMTFNDVPVLKLAEKAKTEDEILKYTLSDLKDIQTLYQMN
jgi:hypothetical protein